MDGAGLHGARARRPHPDPGEHRRVEVTLEPREDVASGTRWTARSSGIPGGSRSTDPPRAGTARRRRAGAARRRRSRCTACAVSARCARSPTSRRGGGRASPRRAAAASGISPSKRSSPRKRNAGDIWPKAPDTESGTRRVKATAAPAGSPPSPASTAPSAGTVTKAPSPRATQPSASIAMPACIDERRLVGVLRLRRPRDRRET